MGANGTLEAAQAICEGPSQRQLLLLARALLWGTELLVLDEPVSALDLNHNRTLFRALRERAADGYAVR